MRIILALLVALLAQSASAAVRWGPTTLFAGSCSVFTFGDSDAADAQPSIGIPAGELAFTSIATSGTAMSVSFYEVAAESADPDSATGTRLLHTATGNSSSPTYASTNGGVLDVDIDTDGDGGSVKVCAAAYASTGRLTPDRNERFAACDKGIPGGDFDPSSGLYGWTCGNYNFGTAGAAYQIACSGDGTASGYTGPGATACLRSGETFNIGALHTIGAAVDRTRSGGTVYLPNGIYVDTGCGTLADGTTRAECPRPYLADRRSRSDWATTGPHTMRFKIVVDRGITLLRESAPIAIESDPSDSTVTKHRPKYVGTWLLQDRGNAGETSSFGTGCAGSDCRTLDGPSEDLQNLGYNVSVGGPDWSNGEMAYCDISTSSADCDEEQNSQEFHAPADFYPYGVKTTILGNTSESAGTICLEDTPSGTTDATYDGVCSLNPLIRCGAAGADIARASHGCGTVAANGYNFGTCQGPITQMSADNTAGARYSLAFEVAQCADNSASSAECGSDAGAATYIAEQRGALGASCSSTGVTLSIGTTGSVSTRSWPFPFGDFFSGGGGTNNVRVIDRDKFFSGGKISGLGFAPANPVGRNSGESTADCLSGGDADDANADDEAACDTQSLVGFPAGANGVVDGIRTFGSSQAKSLASAIDMRGAGMDRQIINSYFSNRRRGTYFDLCSTNFEGNVVADDAQQEFSAGTTGFAFFCQNVRMFNNVFRTVGGGTSFLTLGNNSRNITIENNFAYNIRSSAFLYVGAGIGLNLNKNYIIGLEAGPAVDIEVSQFGASTVNLKKVNISNNLFTGAMTQDSSTANPQAAIVVRSYGGNTTRADDIQGLTITGNHVSNDVPDQCVVWLEDDCAGAGTGGCTGADAAALVAESWTEFDISGNSVSSDGAPRALCIGAFRAAGGHLDATDSRDPLKERYAPRSVGNLANGVLEEGPLLNGQLAAQTPDCDATSACTAGTTVKILDDTAANACTDAGTDDQLDGGGSAVSVCVYNGAAWAPAN